MSCCSIFCCPKRPASICSSAFATSIRKLPVIFITSLSSSETAIKAMTLGAFDYLLKPLDLARIRDLVRQAIEIRRLMSIPVDMPGARKPHERRSRPTAAATRSSATARRCRKCTRRSAALRRRMLRC